MIGNADPDRTVILFRDPLMGLRIQQLFWNLAHNLVITQVALKLCSASLPAHLWMNTRATGRLALRVRTRAI